LSMFTAALFVKPPLTICGTAIIIPTIS
jgi:hypothetical protein